MYWLGSWFGSGMPSPCFAGIDNSYNKDNYSSPLSSDGSIMCYEDTGSVTLRDNANGNKKSGQIVDCGEKVTIIKSKETKGSSCPYWYKINNGKYEGYLCGYFVNTTKLTTTAQEYYNNRTNGDTIETEKRAKIFSNLYLPISLVKTINKEQINVENKYTLEEAKSIGIEQAKQELNDEIGETSNILRWGNKFKGKWRIHWSNCYIWNFRANRNRRKNTVLGKPKRKELKWKKEV